MFIARFLGKNNYVFENTIFRLSAFAAAFIVSSYFSSPSDRVAILLFGSVQLISVFADIGINNALNRDLAVKFNELNSTGYYPSVAFTHNIYRILSLPLSILMLIYAYKILGTHVEYWWLATLNALILYISKPYDIQLRCEGKFAYLNLIEISCNAILIIVILLSVYYKSKLIFSDYAIMIIFCTITTVLSKRFLSNKNKSIQSISATFNYWKSILNSAGQLAHISLALQVMPNLSIPVFASSQDHSSAAALIITYRMMTIGDQLSWSPFYGHLPTWYGLNEVSPKHLTSMLVRARSVLYRLIFALFVILVGICMEPIQFYLKVTPDLLLSISLSMAHISS